MKNKIVGFYDGVLFEEKYMKEYNGIIIRDGNKKLIKIPCTKIKSLIKKEVENE